MREVLCLQEHSVELKLDHPNDAFHLFGSNERHVNLLIFGTSVISNCILFISMLVLFYGFHPVIALLMILAILSQGIIAYKLQQQSFETLVSNSEDSCRLSYYSQALLSSENHKRYKTL